MKTGDACMKIIRASTVIIVLLAAITVAFAEIRYYESDVENISSCESASSLVATSNDNASNIAVFDSLTSDTADAADTAEKIMSNIDNRVSWIKDRIDHHWYNDYYDDDTVIYRYFDCDAGSDSFTTYDSYYNELGKLIYVEIAHYRAAQYSIFFNNNKLLHLAVGPFSYSGGPFINGDISDVQTVVADDPSYAFVLEDLAFCLCHAYATNSSPQDTNAEILTRQRDCPFVLFSTCRQDIKDRPYCLAIVLLLALCLAFYLPSVTLCPAIYRASLTKSAGPI